MEDQNSQVTKTYKLTEVGFVDLQQKLITVADLFKEIAKQKKELNALKASVFDHGELDKINGKLDQLLQAEERLRTSRKRSNDESGNSFKAFRELNDQYKQAVKNSQELAARFGKDSQFAKAAADSAAEYKLQLVEINKLIQNGGKATPAAGSYAQTLAQYKELFALLKNAPKGSDISFQGVTLGFDQAIEKLKQLATAEQDFRRQFAKDGLLVAEYTSGIVQAFKQMGASDLIGGQVQKANTRLEQLNQEFEKTRAELAEIKITGAGSFNDLEKALIANRQEALQLQQQVGTLERELYGASDIGEQIGASLSAGFKDAKEQVKQLLLSYVGIQAVFQAVSSGIDTARELSDQTTNLEVELGKAAGGVREITDELAKLDTRTKLPVLEEIANIAAKAGVSTENLVGVTEALDKIKIAFGSDFGNVEEGTESLVKLINIFEGTDQVTGDQLLKVGNAVRTLANESVASVPFLNDFSKRMAGLKGIADISLPSVLGLASGFEQFGQSSEVAGTALTKIIPKLATDTAKYGEIAGLTQKAFADLLKNNPAEALIKVAEGLTKGKAGIEEISAAFADSELGSGRITAVLGTVGAKADDFRKAIASAGRAYQDTGNIEEAFAAKNNNLAATLDKIGKKFSDAANSRAFQVTLTTISSAILLLLTNIPTVITLLGLWATGWAILNREVLIARAQLLGYNIAIGAYRLLLGVTTIFQTAYNAALALYTGIARGATVATTLLGNAMRLLPLGIILTLIGVVAASFKAFSAVVTGTTEALKKQAIQAQLTADISRRVSEATTDQISKVQVLTNVLRDHNISLETRRKALEDLKNISPEYLSALTLENAATQEGTNLINKYIAALRNKASEEAAQAIRSEKIKKDMQLGLLQQKLETNIANNRNTDLGDLTDEEKEFVGEARKQFAFTASVTDLLTGESAAKEALAGIKAARANIAVELDQTDELIKRKYVQAAQSAVTGISKVASAAAGQVQVDIASMKAQLDSFDKQIESFRGSQADLNKILQERSKLQDAYDKATGNNRSGKAYRGARLTGNQRDGVKNADADRDTLLAEAKLARAELTKQYGYREQDEIDYLQRIQVINQDAIDAKLKQLKGSNAEERRLIAELKLDRITGEQEANQKIFDIRQKALQDQLNQDRRDILEANDKVQQDINATAGQKAQAKLNADTHLLILQENYNTAIDALEKETGQHSIKNTRDTGEAVKNLKADILKDQLELNESALKDIDQQTEGAITEIKLKYEKLKQEILNSKKSISDMSAAIGVLNKSEGVEVAGARQTGLNSKVLKAADLLAEGKITKKEFVEIFDAANQGAQDLNDKIKQGQKEITTFGGLLENKLGKLFGFAEGSDKAKLLGQTITQAFSTATLAMDTYFANEKQRLEASTAAQIKKLEAEKEIAKQRANSQAEKDAIDQRYQAKEDALNRAAFEKQKKMQIAQAGINLATQLTQIAVSASAPGPANILTLGAAGAVLYAVQAALAEAAFLLNVSRIKKATYAYGGNPDMDTIRGGRVKGLPHSQGGNPFMFKGRVFEDEVDELNIIRTRDVPANRRYTITGNHTQIASALNQLGGGKPFMPGAAIRRYAHGGMPGSQLPAPVYIPSPQSGGGVANQSVINELRAQNEIMYANLQALQNTVLTLQVHLHLTGLKRAQDKLVRQRSTGTL